MRQLFFIILFLFHIESISAQIIIDHTCTDITAIPQWAIEAAAANLRIAYAHSSHGRQLAEGMTYLVDFSNCNGLGLALPDNIFAWSEGGVEGSLDFREKSVPDNVDFCSR